jgi:hypothetical protein
MIVDGDFGFAEAVPADDPELRRLLAETPMPGSITVTFEREPDYFVGCATMGHRCDVLVARHLPDGELAGVMCHAIRPVFINGEEREVATIGQVRAAAKFRGKGLLTRGLPLFIEHSRPDLPNYGVMADGNEAARRSMVHHPPPGFVVHDVARINTLGIILRRPKRLTTAPASLTRARMDELPDIVAFLRLHGRSRQYFPAYRTTDFGEGGILPGLDLCDVIVARRGRDIVGTMAVWDQSSYKQTIVQSYEAKLDRLRPWFDRVAPLTGAAPLPAPGEEIRSAYAALVCVARDDRAVMRALLREAYNEACRRGFAYLMIGLTDEDPLLPVARRFVHIPYRSWLQASSWRPDVVGCDLYPSLDGRPAYVEIAAL